jgi:hypothetical protein
MTAPNIQGRFAQEPNWPAGGYMVTRPMDERMWSVQQYTGTPVSNLQAGQWERGQIIRMFTPSFHPNTLGYWPYDPTDPTTWHQPQH